jgi:type IV secretion system protein TrbL
MGGSGDKFLASILALVESGFGTLQGDVFGLTSILIMATFGMLGIKFILSGEEGKAVIGQFFMTVLYVGFLTFVIKNWPTIYKEIGGFFQDLGGVAGKVGDAGKLMHEPSRVLDSLDLAKAPIEQKIDDMMAGLGVVTNSGKVFSYWIALGFLEIAFILLYLNMFFAIVEFHLVSLAAWPFLAFSAFKGSAFLAERPLGFVFAAGAKLFVMTMILGFSINFFNSAALPPADPTIGQSLDAATMSLLIMILGFAVPVAAAALISGGPGLSAALPMMTAIGAAMAVKEGVAAARQGITSGPVRAVGSATAAAAGRASASFGQSFSPGGAAHMAMSSMRGGTAARPAASATASAAGAAAAGRGSSAVAGMRSAYNRSPSRSGSGHRTDLLQRVRSAIPPGTEGQASGSAPRLSGDI